MTYQNDLLAAPAFSASDSLAGEGVNYYGDKPTKVYRYGPSREVVLSVYQGAGVTVDYAPTGRTVSWDWADRSAAFSWAQERGEHTRLAGY
tara:strand:+ start:966 stop:1238 length:273 start_codon:yes stop_codon:yes gene_type:complete